MVHISWDWMEIPVCCVCVCVSRPLGARSFRPGVRLECNTWQIEHLVSSSRIGLVPYIMSSSATLPYSPVSEEYDSRLSGSSWVIQIQNGDVNRHDYVYSLIVSNFDISLKCSKANHMWYINMWSTCILSDNTCTSHISPIYRPCLVQTEKMLVGWVISPRVLTPWKHTRR